MQCKTAVYTLAASVILARTVPAAVVAEAPVSRQGRYVWLIKTGLQGSPAARLVASGLSRTPRIKRVSARAVACNLACSNHTRCESLICSCRRAVPRQWSSHVRHSFAA